MSASTRNVVATLLVAVIVVTYIGFLTWGELPLLEDLRGMGASGLILGLAAAAVIGRAVFDPDPLSRAALVCGVITLITGVASIWVGTSDGLLAVFIGLIAATWSLGELAYSRSATKSGRGMVASR